jgi:hypothetical protein
VVENRKNFHWHHIGVPSCSTVQTERATTLLQVTTNFAYLPFGGGKRKCIGDQFALFESIVALAMLSRRFTFEADDDNHSVGMTTGATIHTTEGLHVYLRPRTHSSVAVAVAASEVDTAVRTGRVVCSDASAV